MSRKPKQHKSADSGETMPATAPRGRPINGEPPPKRKRGSIVSGGIRECIENAFHEAGGRDYLVWVARRRPDVFLQLLARIIPSEARIAVLHGYQAMPVPVEQRDAIPAAAEPTALPGPVIQEIPGQEIPAAVLRGDPDWLSVS